MGWLLLTVLFAVACTSAQPHAPHGDSISSGASPAGQTELMISAAASLTDALQEIKKSFEERYPAITLTFTFGSSGHLARQIEQGAPSDLFLSASRREMDTLEKKHLIDKDSRVDFAGNRLVLIAAKESAWALSSFEEIQPEQLQYLAIGDPESVPVGQYAKEVLQSLMLWDALEGKLVLGADVRQVLTYVESGNVELGIVYSSDTVVSSKVNVLAAARPEWHKPILYPAAIVAESPHKREARVFLDYLTGEQGKRVLKKYGFQ
ncbi:MAG: molybdate ABC transporter substrate-binding protein [Brevibacillus sp.]|nr:molybdate ABC transporter substrate-binding protein [Brevibacillus sp.]